MDDRVRRRRHPHLGDVAQPYVTTIRGVDQQFMDVGQALTGLGLAPDDDVVGLAIPVDVAYLFAGHQRGRRAADVTRLEAVLLGRGQVDLDFDLRHIDQELDVLLDDAVDPR